MAERSYPPSKVSGGREETPCVQSQGRQPGGATPHLRSGAVAKRSYPEPEAKGGSWEEPPTAEARAGSREEQPEEVAAQAQEVLEELSHIEDQERRR